MAKKQTITTVLANRNLLKGVRRTLMYMPVLQNEMISKPVVHVLENDYVAWFYHPTTKRKIGEIGNVSVAYDEVIPLLKRLGFEVKVTTQSEENAG